MHAVADYAVGITFLSTEYYNSVNDHKFPSLPKHPYTLTFLYTYSSDCLN